MVWQRFRSSERYENTLIENERLKRTHFSYTCATNQNNVDRDIDCRSRDHNLNYGQNRPCRDA
jgi:hypothetical protein